MSKARSLADLGNVYDDGALSNRNLIINGAMQVAQGTGTNSGLDGYYTVDRMRVEAGSAGTTIETSQSTDAPTGFKNSFQYQIKSESSTVTNSSSVVYRIEGQDMSHLEWGTSNAKTITLSFYVKCSKALSSLGGSVTNNAFNMTYPFDYAISTADTWERKTITIEGPTSGTWLDTNGAGVRLNFNLGSASARLATADTWANTVARGPTGAGNITQTDEATWQITGLQWELGDTATPFEHRSYGQELALCQRYYEKLDDPMMRGLETATLTGQRMGCHFLVKKRAAPSVTLEGTLRIYNGNGVGTVTHADMNATWANPSSFNFDKGSGTITGTGMSNACVSYTATSGTVECSLLIDAEL